MNKAKVTANIVGIITILDFVVSFLYVVITTIIYLCNVLPDIKALDILLIGPLFGTWRFLSIPYGIMFLWPEAMEGLLLSPWVITIIMWAILIEIPILIVLKGIGYKNYIFINDKVENFVIALMSIITYSALLAIYSLLLFNSCQYFHDTWEYPFWGAVVGIPFAIFRFILLSIGGGFWAPTMFENLPCTSIDLSIAFFVTLVVITALVIVTSLTNKKAFEESRL